MGADRIGIGLRAQSGGAIVVAVRCGAEVSVILSTFLATHAEDEPLSLKPYGAAYDIVHGVPRGTLDAAGAAVAEGRGRQDALAEAAVKALRGELGEMTAGLLVNRAGWITDLLGHALGWAEHVPVVEGLAVRDALRTGLARSDVPFVELDEKTLDEQAAQTLGLSTEAIEARLKAMGQRLKPWRKEQKLACLAGWLAAAG